MEYKKQTSRKLTIFIVDNNIAANNSKWNQTFLTLFYREVINIDAVIQKLLQNLLFERFNFFFCTRVTLAYDWDNIDLIKDPLEVNTEIYCFALQTTAVML